jgi:hypothetical protein
MISGSPQETQAQLDEDLDRQSTRMAQMAVEGAGLSAAVTRRTALSKVQMQAHKDVATAKADHTALLAVKYDALIDGAQTDPVAVAREIQASGALVETYVGKLRRVTEDRLPLANLDVLKAEKAVKLIALDLKIVEGRIHNAQLLLAASPAAEVGGDLIIKSAVAQRIGLEEAQCAADLEQASLALQHEIEHQQKIRDARSRPSGPISYVNPSS